MEKPYLCCPRCGCSRRNTALNVSQLQIKKIPSSLFWIIPYACNHLKRACTLSHNSETSCFLFDPDPHRGMLLFQRQWRYLTLLMQAVVNIKYTVIEATVRITAPCFGYGSLLVNVLRFQFCCSGHFLWMKQKYQHSLEMTILAQNQTSPHIQKYITRKQNRQCVEPVCFPHL